MEIEMNTYLPSDEPEGFNSQPLLLGSIPRGVRRALAEIYATEVLRNTKAQGARDALLLDMARILVAVFREVDPIDLLSSTEHRTLLRKVRDKGH